MSGSDGSIGGVVKVVDHGPASARWNLVVLGDGYQASELAKFHTDVENFISTISSTPPYDELWCGINVYRIDVTSTDSGADDPTTCAGGTGATPHTYYDATFCSPWNGGHLDRLLTVDAARARADAHARVPETHQVLVIVNSSKYGGSGGKDAATCSTNAAAAKIAIHEIGHSAYGLADEYENGATATGGEPFEPNVTLDPNRATNKWRDLVDPSTPMPSSCYGDCAAGCTPPATPPAAGATGAYEGARYFHCGMYRPATNCYMRDYSPFCAVCTRVIRQTLSPFQPAESITSTTPSINFQDIPEGVSGTGVTTYRAVVFEVIACRKLTFRFTAPPTGGFGTPFGLVTTVGPGEHTSSDFARLWLSYTSTTAGSTAFGTVTVRCDETGQTWPINILANTVARPKAAVALVLDHSGSMAEDAGDSTSKVQKLREAARVFVDAMLPGDGIGVVRFDDTVQRLMNVEDVGALGTGVGRMAALGHINGTELDPAGATSIGGGVAEGKAALDDAQATAMTPYNVQAMVVLTDGVENSPPMIADVSSSITANTFAVGFGLPYNISVPALNALTQGHNGYLLVTGTLTSDQRTRLTKYFLQILAGITNANVVVDPSGWLARGIVHRIPFVLSETDYAFDAFVLTPYPQAIEYALETPDGSIIDAANFGGFGTTERLVRDGVAFYRTALPAIPARAVGSHVGTWNAILSLGKNVGVWNDRLLAAASGGRGGVLPYDFLVHCYSNLVFHTQVLQKSIEPGAIVQVFAMLKEYDVPVGSRAMVWTEIKRPDGTQFVIPLDRDPQDQFTGSFATSIPGLYVVRARAHGETFRGNSFTREQTLTAVAVVGGDRPGAKGDNPMQELLCCLLHGEKDTGKLWERLAAMGLDSDHLRDCLKRLCSSSEAAMEQRRGGGRANPAAALDVDTVINWLRNNVRPG
jgi:IgA Peptidase M64/von Willebrand factor type A domain